ncbi:TRDC protein, partial [Polyodon spathula]|nr:TRDC protein [Polyodon spathula]
MGNGTMLTVNPKDTTRKTPSLFVFTPPNIGDPAACVATGFFPEKLEISMKIGDTVSNVTSNDKAVLSLNDKTYNFATFMTVKEKVEEVICEADGKIKESIKNEKSTDEAGVISAQNCERNDTFTVQKRVTVENIQLNFKSLTVQGLRVMFVKTVTFNFLMTARALMF